MEIRESDERKYSELNLHELTRLIKGFLIDYPFVRAAYLCPGVERPYNLLFEVPIVPLRMADLYKLFMEDLSDGPEYLKLSRAYKNRDNVSIDEWMWYEVVDAEDIEGEGLHNFVLPGEAVCLFTQDEDQTRLSLPQSQTTAPHEAGVPQNIFLKEGDRWKISYRGSTTSIGDLKGLRDIAELLRNPKKEIHVLQLIHWLPIEETEFGKMTEDQLKEKGMRKTLGLDALNEAWDDQAIGELKKRVEEIRREKLGAEYRAGGMYRDEIDGEENQIHEQLKTAIRPNGKLRKERGSIDTARRKVLGRINTALKRIKKDIPSLYQHLQKPTLRTGTTCCYNPPDDISWTVTV